MLDLKDEFMTDINILTQLVELDAYKTKITNTSLKKGIDAFITKVSKSICDIDDKNEKKPLNS